MWRVKIGEVGVALFRFTVPVKFSGSFHWAVGWAGGDPGGKQQLASLGERQNGPSTFFHGAHGTGGQAGRALSPKTVAEMTGFTARLPSEGVRRMGWAGLDHWV